MEMGGALCLLLIAIGIGIFWMWDARKGND